ncbi:carnosine N-methyltransferase-like [Rosa chinensis]|uniref:carnosine N-methyltransferase-like n=1 Tax=Rosa chinensis TaxID=74649 RepID=UPI001AD8EDC0|nr:carnosine N-methyltransferase-like [Rosa chinensis]
MVVCCSSLYLFIPSVVKLLGSGQYIRGSTEIVIRFQMMTKLRPVSIPDIHPASAGITEGFSMCGGDFVEVYNDPSQVGAWDAVVTCFFIDTAHNIVEYIETLSRILK